jgi:hypothetical protein
MVTLSQASALADQLSIELAARAGEIDRHHHYYKGRHPLRFASTAFRRHFEQQYRDFSDNWTQPVADSPVERLTVTGIKPADTTEADKALWQVWQRNALDADSQLGFQGAVLAGRTFCLVWGDPDEPDVPVVTFEDARQAIVAYVPGSRRKRRAGLKTWQDGSREFATLYLPDEVWKLERAWGPEPRKRVGEAAVDDLIDSWTPRDTGAAPNPQPNPLGVVPLVELPNRPFLADEPISDVSGVIAMQDAINLLWAQLFTATDYAAFPQKVVLGAEAPKVPILDKDGQVIGERAIDLEKFAVNRVAWIEDENAKIDNWPATNLAAYTGIIEVAVGHIAAQTRTPPHYLVGKMANLSGDALTAAETGLVKKTQEKQLWFGQGLREVFRLIALARGEDAKADSIAAGSVLWADAESRNQAQVADALLKLRDIGFPFEWLALRYGLTPTEVADVVAMREREAALDPAAQILGVRPKDGQSLPNVPPPPPETDVGEALPAGAPQ